MPKCPYCKAELKLNLSIEPSEIGEEFKKEILAAMKDYIDVRAEMAPFGGGLMKSMSKMSLKWVNKYFDKVGALPMLYQTCANCDTVINTEIIANVSAAFGSSSGSGR